MKVIDNSTETNKLTNRDLALAAYSLAELHNVYLNSYESGDYESEMTKEQIEETMESLRVAHIKFDAILQATEENFQREQSEESPPTDGE